ncbi:DUF3892 domain-containing protein [Sphingopyxis sp. PET50]|uniref:DUF3892 domain-containing protein n=1 Tax=Sphingopyxis sp. PET50 TaxID=2976533 RepID=UPI0021AE4A67|nr:DUF3892 domain-containing protein [Sphingopyxis sp. PET50]
MTTYRAECHTPDNLDTDRRLQGLGGSHPHVWWYGIDTIIRMIDGGNDIFYTMVDGKVALIEVATHPVSKRRYLKTVRDSYPYNNLLYLPHCP